MATADRTIVFIPAWNEEQNLPGVPDELQAELPDGDVLVVDAGSTGTAVVARAAGADVRSFGENRGLRAGIATGYREAAERGYAYCGRVDADGQHRARELARLLAVVRSGTCDAAIGSRFAEGRGYDDDRYKSRERQSGNSKRQGRKAVKLVLTVIGTLLFVRWLTRRKT